MVIVNACQYHVKHDNIMQLHVNLDFKWTSHLDVSIYCMHTSTIDNYYVTLLTL